MPILRIKKNVADRKKRVASVVEKFVVCETHDGGKFYAKHSADDFVRLCVPNGDGVLLVTDEVVDDATVKSSHDLNATPVFEAAKLKHFNTRPEFEVDQKAVRKIDDDKSITDYLDLKLKGHASTFAKVTARDRDGDTVADNAFTKTIAQFMKNPVMLIDHTNSVNNIAGSFTSLVASDLGLEVQAQISNAPDLRSVRFKIAEGHLKAFSIGGLFRFDDSNPKMIAEVDLFEISLVAVPANPDALFDARSVSVDDAKAAFKRMKLMFKS